MCTNRMDPTSLIQIMAPTKESSCSVGPSECGLLLSVTTQDPLSDGLYRLHASNAMEDVDRYKGEDTNGKLSGLVLIRMFQITYRRSAPPFKVGCNYHTLPPLTVPHSAHTIGDMQSSKLEWWGYSVLCCNSVVTHVTMPLRVLRPH
jgi:hypothetical protein